MSLPQDVDDHPLVIVLRKLQVVDSPNCCQLRYSRLVQNVEDLDITGCIVRASDGFSL